MSVPESSVRTRETLRPASRRAEEACRLVVVSQNMFNHSNRGGNLTTLGAGAGIGAAHLFGLVDMGLVVILCLLVRDQYPASENTLFLGWFTAFM